MEQVQELQVMEARAFKPGKEEYGVDILKVQEIHNDAVTRIANSPEFIKSVIKLRGVIVPVIDMRKMLLTDIDRLISNTEIGLIDKLAA
jgi:purine-binding chemotaxis protein CheW